MVLRRNRNKNQLLLHFMYDPGPFGPAAGNKRDGHLGVKLVRQPSNFPKGWFKWSLTDPDWRHTYYALWQKKRRAANLPYEIKNPLPSRLGQAYVPIAETTTKITDRRAGASAGYAVPGKLCAPRQMTA